MKRTEKCSRCGVTVAVELLDTPNRCLDSRCPLFADEMRLGRAVAIGCEADRLAARNPQP